jgi:UDP-N-acetylglucosamine 2-epimerase
MEQCILGTSWEKPGKAPPCRQCVRFSSKLMPSDGVIRLQKDRAAWSDLSDLPVVSLEELESFTFNDYPLGRIVLPGVHWAMRRTDLGGDDAARSIYLRYLRSATSLVQRFEEIFNKLEPQAIVVFNGIFFPEAVAREVAIRFGVSVVTHEVGLRPYSAFFSHDHATFRQVKIPDEFELSKSESTSLDQYLESRFSGRFSMAGIDFWPDMQSVPDLLAQKMASFEKTVVVFTNVIFDTSQIHANAIFKDMFAWLEGLRSKIEQHPETLFVIRAHPDEDRYGKRSRQSVSQWVKAVDLLSKANVAFIESSEYVSSYELIESSALILVYNSSIGLEASILGKRVIAAGKARYTQAETVFFPATAASYWEKLEESIQMWDEEAPQHHRANARKLIHLELFRASLDFSNYLEPDPMLRGMVVFKGFSPEDLGSDAGLDVVHEGVIEGKPFILPHAVD